LQAAGHHFLGVVLHAWSTSNLRAVAGFSNIMAFSNIFLTSWELLDHSCRGKGKNFSHLRCHSAYDDEVLKLAASDALRRKSPHSTRNLVQKKHLFLAGIKKSCSSTDLWHALCLHG
jgi:hypothetical protein